MDWPRWLIVVILWTTVRAFDCPDIKDCGDCLTHPDGHIEIECNIRDKLVFKINIKPGRQVLLECPLDGPTDWSALNLNDLRPIDNVKSLFVKNCDLPNDDTLGQLARGLFIEDVVGLAFKSYRNIDSRLTADHLKNFSHVRNLTLSNNKLSNLPENLLQDFQNLTQLVLVDNHLQYLPKKFLQTPNLRALDIGKNRLEFFDPNGFDDLENLVLLNAWNNNITEIAPGTFDKLRSLKSLDMRRNTLTHLPSNIFGRLENLENVSLSQNSFVKDSLPGDLFRNNSKLILVNLFENKKNMTTLPDEFFADLKNLKIVNLRRNGFTWLPENLFRGTTNLQTINLERNILSTLPEKIFRDCANVESINLYFNDLNHLPDGIFANFGKLTKLNLGRNQLAIITENLLSGLSSLVELNIENNRLTTIHGNAFTFLPNLRIATFSRNLLQLESCSRLGPSPFQSCKTIQQLDLSYNNITDMCEDWKMGLPNLRSLKLDHNRVETLESTDFNFVFARADNQITVDLSFNNITAINGMQTVEIWASENREPKWLKFKITNNPLRCDCGIYSLLRFSNGRMSTKATNAFTIDLGKTKCAEPDDYRQTAVADLKPEELTCEVVDKTNNKLFCPHRCNCLARPEDNTLLINCVNQSLTEAPHWDDVPGPNTRIELDLSHNLLTKLPTFDEPKYDRVRTILLDHNVISNLSIVKLPKNLEVLQLHNNNLTSLSPDAIIGIGNATKLKTLTLHGNPWTCDCGARNLYNYIQSNTETIKQFSEIICDVTNVAISTMTLDEICPTDYHWIIIGCLVVAFFGITIGALAALYYRHQREIKVWLYSRQWCLWFVTEDELDRDKIYDAFVSYSHKDEDFVVKDLLPKLEDGPRPFKLCVHFRDWLAGEWIPNQIARSVEQSRRTIVVLSPNFLESVWGRMEFRAAHSQALSEGRARVIVILYGDIGPTADLDPELKAYLTMNTYVKWGDPWFWEKLKYAMPHSRKFANDNERSKIFATTNGTPIGLINDKIELIRDEKRDNSRTIEIPKTNEDVVIDVPEISIMNDRSDKLVELSVENLNNRNNVVSETIGDKNLENNFTNMGFNDLRCTTV